MRRSLVFFSLLLSLISSGQTHKGLPVIRSSAPRVSYLLENELLFNAWGVDPAVPVDVLEVPYEKPLRVGFKSDRDSIFYIIKDEKPFQFYIQVRDTAFALTEIRGKKKKAIAFDKNGSKENYEFWYETNPGKDYLTTLTNQYELKKLVDGINSDTAKVLRIVNWVHNQWPHNGGNVPRRPDALTILEEAKQGKNFRCTEYSIVTAAALKALGYKARMMYIYSADVETTTSGGSHVDTEVYLDDYKKWVMLDGQHDVMPLLNGVPLNTVELQDAIVNKYHNLEIRSLSGKGKRYYTTWIYPYLYYFETDFDNREGQGRKENFNGKIGLRLGPVGSGNPTKFQGQWPMSNASFTHVYKDLYPR